MFYVIIVWLQQVTHSSDINLVFLSQAATQCDSRILYSSNKPKYNIMAEIEYSFVSIYHIIIFLIQLTGLYYIIIVIITIIDKGAQRHKDLQNNLNVWTDQSYSLTG